MSYFLLFKENFSIQSSSLCLPVPNHESLEETSSESYVVNSFHTGGAQCFFWVLWDLSWRVGDHGVISCLHSWKKSTG